MITVEDMCRRYPNATEVNVSGSAVHSLVMRAISSLRYILILYDSQSVSTVLTYFLLFIIPRNLEVLTLGRGQLVDVFFHSLADCHVLRRLNVNDATLGNGVQEIPINHDRLRHLQLTKCRVMRISIR